MAQQRDQTIDVARGIAIVAIVAGHVWRGMAGADLVDASTSAYLTLDRGLYFFHLAVFVFAAGLFVQRGVERDGSLAYLGRRSWLFLYLYLLWTAIQGAVRVAAGSLANAQLSWTDLLRLWIPEGQLWFLPFMIQMTLVAVVFQPWRDRRSAMLSLIFAGAASIAAWGIDLLWAGGRGLGLTVFFVAGAAFGGPRFSSLIRRLSPSVALGGALVAGLLWAGLLIGSDASPPTVDPWPREGEDLTLGVVATVASIVTVLLLSRALASAPGGRSLAFLGRRSLEIFLAHIVMTAGTRIALMLVDVTDPAVHLLAGTLLGVAGPVLLWWVVTRSGIGGWLFHPPGVGSRSWKPRARQAL